MFYKIFYTLHKSIKFLIQFITFVYYKNTFSDIINKIEIYSPDNNVHKQYIYVNSVPYCAYGEKW